jgi:type VI protein secretion system component VasF
MPSPARAERNQRRKLAFIPVWPVVAAIVVVVVLVLLTR